MGKSGKIAIAVATTLLPIGQKVMDFNLPLAITLWAIAAALYIWSLATVPAIRRFSLRLVPPFLRPVPKAPEFGLFEVWANAPRLGELFVPELQSIRQAEEQIAAISAKYRPVIRRTWLGGAGSQRAAKKAIRLARREARAINRRLDRIEGPAARFEKKTETIGKTLVGHQQRVREGGDDRAGLIIVRDGMQDLVSTMEGQRDIDERFRGVMLALQGPSSELIASSARGAALGSRIVAGHDVILGAARSLLDLTNEMLAAPMLAALRAQAHKTRG